MPKIVQVIKHPNTSDNSHQEWIVLDDEGFVWSTPEGGWPVWSLVRLPLLPAHPKIVDQSQLQKEADNET